jgi:hypothetical protein
VLALSHGLTVGLSIAAVAVVVLLVGLLGGYWARRGSARHIIRDEPKDD